MLLDLIKAGTFAMLSFGLALAPGYALTGSAACAVGIAFGASSLGSFAFLLHERVWMALRQNRR